MPAPLLVLTATQNGQAGAWLTLDASKQGSGFWTSATPDGYSHSVQFLASGSTPGLLQPGESVTVPVYYAGWEQRPVGLELPDHLQPWRARQLQHPDHRLDSLKDSLRPASLSQAAWNAIYPNLTAQLGSTWGGYVRSWPPTPSTSPASARTSPTSVSCSASRSNRPTATARLPAWPAPPTPRSPRPDSPLSFARTFTRRFIERNQSGRFGWGWDDSWDTHVTVDADGSVNVYEPGGSIRRFQPDSRGGYFAQPGDHGTLAARSGGGYTLTELDGQITAYNADGSLAYVQDTNGNRITAGYTGGLLTSLTHSSGQSLTLAYNAAGLVSTITDSAGRTPRTTTTRPTSI